MAETLNWIGVMVKINIKLFLNGLVQFLNICIH